MANAGSTAVGGGTVSGTTTGGRFSPSTVVVGRFSVPLGRAAEGGGGCRWAVAAAAVMAVIGIMAGVVAMSDGTRCDDEDDDLKLNGDCRQKINSSC